ncbi:helix-turn-helix domain-containing protein [Ruoffia tabacinasalis]|uniref:Helix-turn-helix transcriptional regulator n=1 Tax=Ruoffia tabacinasalis TaxID=87458 RepID=A0ABS0LPA2_9LACT|nr:helix-turn-helix transcriptional regulator [Ruoffia tabacinasalis]MBG9979244.1 helix-turn-helix transcriptional regulator [Ruoffia tabacinasalis]
MKFNRIRDLREDNDFTQNYVAKIINCSRSVYSMYESGKMNIPIDIFISMANIYEVSIDYLLNRTNNKKINE